MHLNNPFLLSAQRQKNCFELMKLENKAGLIRMNATENQCMTSRQDK